MNKLDQLYFNWLTSRVCSKGEVSSYRDVLEHLFYADYVWDYDMDQLRAMKGLEMRERFFDESSMAKVYAEKFGIPTRDCTILEVMVSLADDIEDIFMSSSVYGDRRSEWFWVMMVSLGLNKFADNNYDEEKVQEILEKFLDHDYKKDGTGGLFVIKCVKNDMRRLTLWQQANAFLGEID